MKDDFQFGNDFFLSAPFGGDSPLPRALAASDNETSLEEGFRWHRIRRMSRK